MTASPGCDVGNNPNIEYSHCGISAQKSYLSKNGDPTASLSVYKNILGIFDNRGSSILRGGGLCLKDPGRP